MPDWKRDSKGRFAFDEGSGKHNIPTPSDTAVMPSQTNEAAYVASFVVNDLDVYTQAVKNRALLRGRELSDDELRTEVDRLDAELDTYPPVSERDDAQKATWLITWNSMVGFVDAADERGLVKEDGDVRDRTDFWK